MYVQTAARNIFNVRMAFATIATMLQLTSYKYPISQPVKDGAAYDYVIVGAGTAGSVVANRLTEDPSISVLLIEAGGDPPIESNLPSLFSYTLKSHSSWNYTSQEDSQAFHCVQNNRYYMSQGRLLGGSSSTNDMFYVRGTPHDFDTWAAMTGDQSWSYENVLPYFKKSERLDVPDILNSNYEKYHGTDGNMGITEMNFDITKQYLESFKELGYDILLDINGEKTLGFTPQLFAIANGTRQGTANAFLSIIKDRPNLHVKKESMAEKIVIDHNKVAKGVVVTDMKTGRTITVEAKKEVIVSAGSISNPRLLMLSGIGPMRKLKQLNIKVVADLPVGEELQTHTPVVLIVKTSKPSDKSKPVNPHKYSVPAVTGYVSLNISRTNPEYQATIVSVNDESMVELCSELYNFKQNICQYHYNQIKGKDALFIILMGLDSRPKGRVSIQGLNPEENPTIYMNRFPDKIDLEKYSSYAKDILRVVNTTYFNSVNAEFVGLPQCKHFPKESTDYWNCHLGCMSSSSMHYTSTCAMGSVVDSRLRVLGVKNLRIADASIMPTITSGNTMAPTIMIGEKASDFIKADNL